MFLNNPIPFYCVNQPVNYNHGVIDVDGDSLAFHPVFSRSNGGPSVSYAAGYNGNTPFNTNAINPYTVDAINGDINYTPDALQVAVAAIRVDEYRNGVLIGCVVRDMQFTIINCTNQLPTASGINGSNNFVITLPACSDTCFTITSNDADAGDNVTMTNNNGIPGSSFTTSTGQHPTGTFCWATTSADVGTNFFTVTVQDDHCPITGNNTYSYTIHVIPSNDPPVSAGPDVTICPGVSTTLNATVIGGTATSYSWSDGVNTWSTSSITVSPVATTIYTVTAYYADGCSKSDAVVVNVIYKPDISIFPANSTLCSGGSVSLLASTAAANPTYHWIPTTNLSCTTCPNPIATPSTSATYCVYVTIGGTCPSDTVCSVINSAAPPPAQSCVVIYATTNGNGVGTPASPTNLSNALDMARCNNSIIKLGTGTYFTDTVITSMSSYVTLEGGYNPVTWVKTSLPGATTITRTANILDGPANAFRLMAMYVNSASYFRLQDLTINTVNAPVADSFGISTYGLYLQNCSNYDIVRCQFQAGNASAGKIGTAGTNGTSGANGITANGKNGAPAPLGPNAGGAGGNGGNSGIFSGNNANAGLAGSGPSPGAGGAGGVGATGCASTFGNNSNYGSPGGAGLSGTNGTTGLGGNAGIFSAGFFTPGTLGGIGTDGTDGSGGGGGGGNGGAGAGTDGGGGGSGGSGGVHGTHGTGGYGGGSAFAVILSNNGVAGNFTNCNIAAAVAGAGGAGGAGGVLGVGGTGGQGGTDGTGGVCDNNPGDGGNGGNGGSGGSGGSGASGLSARIYLLSGTPETTADSMFNLSGQPTINVNDVNCTNRPVNFSSGASGNWDFGTVSIPPTATGASVNTMYTTFGRKNITYNANSYIGFFNIPIDNNTFIPQITTTAHPFGVDTFTLCQGSAASFTGVVPSADMFDWNFGGAVVPNTYNGPNFQFLPNLTFNTAGTFLITLRINTTCCGWSPLDSIWLVVEPNPTIAFSGLTVFCQGDSVTITASGSTNYTWTPPTGLNTTSGATVVAKPLVTTTYLVHGTTASGYCFADSQVTVTVRVHPTVTFSSTPAICGGTGTITATPNPAGSYGYSWNDPLNQTTQTATNLQAGGYSVTISDLTSNCTAYGGSLIGSGGTVQAYIDSSAPVTCAGFCDGVARVRGILGSLNYTYVWNSGATTPSIINICANNYSVTVTDATSGCTASATVTISQPLPIQLFIVDTVDATCANSNNGSALAEAIGGTGFFTYLWSDPSQQDTAHAVNLAPGIYNVTVIDVNGCTASGTVPILSPPPVLVDTVTVVDVSCNGAGDGAITLSVTGGVYPYTYVWQQIPAETDSITTNIAGGNYTIVVADIWQCKDTIVVPVIEPALLAPAIANTDSVKCFGGNDGLVDLTATGGTSPYQYSLDGITFQASATFNGLSANNYTATVRDAHLCVKTIVFTIYQPTILVAALQGTTNVKCFGGNDGTATITINGGTPTYIGTLGAQTVSSSPYTFTTLAAGNYTITATDANACTTTVTANITEPTQLVLNLLGTTPTTCFGGNDGGINVNANGGTPAYLYSLNGGTPQASGNFTNVNGALNVVAVVDANMCIDTLHINVPQPPQTIFLDTAVVDVNCFGGNNGSIDLTVTGTTGPWTFVWNTGPTSEDLAGLIAGIYQVTVTDNLGCTGTGIDSIVIAQPAVLALTQVTQNVSCFGGSNASITVTATGGVPAYVYAWSSGQNTAQISNLSIGSFNITVTDAHNCTVALSNIIVTQPALLTVSTVANQVSCPGFSDGSVIATPIGGTPAYNYNWNPAAPNAAIDANVPAGVYNVTVTDANSCTATSTNTVIQLPGIVVLADIHNVLCDPLHNGYIDLSAQTFNPPATYLWSNGATTQDITSLYIGNYSVTITDANNCSVDTSFTVLNDSAFVVVASPHQTVIDLGESVDIVATISGGTLANIIWTPSEFLSCGDCLNPNASPVNSIYYIATATSDSGCVASDKVVITVVPDYSIFIPNVFTPNGDGNNDFFEVFGNKKAWKQFEVQVFNRWGEKVYESGDMNFKWDGIYKGQPSPQAVYVYQIHLVYLDNYTDKLYKGSVTLVR